MSTWQLHTKDKTLDLIDFGYLNAELNCLNEFAEVIKDKEIICKIDHFNKKATDLLKEYYKLEEEMTKLIKNNNLDFIA
jgi:hypothetical protein